MKIRTIAALLSLALVCAASSSARAQGSPEGQFRFLIHKQYVPEGRSIGLAGWAVKPDVLKADSPKALLVAGLLLKGDGRWTEIMLGELVGPNGHGQEVLNLRSSAAWAKGKQ